MPVSEQLRLEQTEALMLKFMMSIKGHYRATSLAGRPASPMHVLEVLNALAYCTATVLGGTIDDDGKISVKAEAFFAEALRDAIAHIRRHPQQ
jgi:hypothetical protein